MLQFLYDLTQSPFFPILVAIWILIDVVWIGRWKALLDRLGKLITKPIIFAKDPKPTEPPLYPREMLEQLAQVASSRERQKDAGQGSRSNADQKDGKKPRTSFLAALRDSAFDPEHPLRTLGSILFLVFFILFLTADAISVAQTLRVMGLLGEEVLSGLFERFDLAVLGGALLSAVVGVWVFAELLGFSDFIDVERLSPEQKGFLKGLSMLVTVLSVVVLIAFAVQRLVAIGSLQSDPTLDVVLSFILYGLVPLNSALAAAICFPWAGRGLIVVLLILAFIVIGILPVIAFLVDILWRLGYIVLDISIWALFTPLMAIPVGLGKVFGLLGTKKD